MIIIIKLSLQTLEIQADCLKNANNITKYYLDNDLFINEITPPTLDT